MHRLRRWASPLLVVLAVAASDAALHRPMPEVPANTVFVTETGEKYHLENCRHLKQSRKELTLEQAKKQGYKPCGTCKPPQ